MDMIPYQHIQTYGTSDKTWLSALSDLSIKTIGGRPYLFTVTQQHGGGVTVYQPDAVTGLLTRIDTQAFPAGASYQGSPEISFFNNGISENLYLTNLGESEYLALNLSTKGKLGDYDVIASPDQFRAVTAFGEFETPQGRFLYSAFQHDLSIHIAKIEDDGSLTHRSSAKIPLPHPHEHASVERLLVTSAGDKQYMMAISGLGDFIAAYEIKETGELVTGSLHSGNMGIGYNTPTDAVAAEVDGESYIIVASPGSSSLTVFKLGQDGKLNAVDHVPDTLNTRFERITTIEAVVIEGRSFIFAGGTDDGISVFTLQPGGTLVHLQSIADLDGLTLNQVSDIAAMVRDGKLEVFVSAATETGITHLRFDPGQIGQTGLLKGVNARGTAANDLLIAAPDTRNLFGGDGDDILISGSNSIQLHGGPGRDTFVPTGIAGTITIRDFEPGIDYIDLSQLEVAGSIHDLRINFNAANAVIKRLDTRIVIKTKDGVAFNEDDLTNANFVIAHYNTPEQEPVFLPRPTTEELLKPYLLGEFPKEEEHPDPLLDIHPVTPTPPSADRPLQRQDEPQPVAPAAPSAPSDCFSLAEQVRKNLPVAQSESKEALGKSALDPYFPTQPNEDAFIFEPASDPSPTNKYSADVFSKSGPAPSDTPPAEINGEHQTDALPPQSPGLVLYDVIENEYSESKMNFPEYSLPPHHDFLL